MSGHQVDLFETESERLAKAKKYDENQISLPVDPLQEKYANGEIVLTDCEFEIMQLILTGASIPQISIKIFRSIAGVKWRLSSVYYKFSVRNRLQLINKASVDGLQFRTSSGVKHTFHNKLNMRAHDEKP